VCCNLEAKQIFNPSFTIIEIKLEIMVIFHYEFSPVASIIV